MEMDHATGAECRRLIVPEDVCYIGFVDPRPPLHGLLVTKIGVETVRGEMLVLTLDEGKKVVGIELIKPGGKKCQPIWGHGCEDR